MRSRSGDNLMDKWEEIVLQEVSVQRDCCTKY